MVVRPEALGANVCTLVVAVYLTYSVYVCMTDILKSWSEVEVEVEVEIEIEDGILSRVWTQGLATGTGSVVWQFEWNVPVHLLVLCTYRYTDIAVPVRACLWDQIE